MFCHEDERWSDVESWRAPPSLLVPRYEHTRDVFLHV
jgi:hypothetical protein